MIARRALIVCVLLSCGPFALAQAAAGLQLSPSSIDFGSDAVSSDSAPRNVTVTNTAKSPLAVEQILTSGIDFSQKNDCGQKLAPGGQCTIQVSFSPVISGPRTGSLQIMSSDGNPYYVALTGTGT